MVKYKIQLGDSIKKIWNNLKNKINKETYTKDEVILYGQVKENKGKRRKKNIPFIQVILS